MTAPFVQRITVPFEYPVFFSRGLFAPTNHDLLQAVTTREPDRRHRILVVIDAGVNAAWPALPAAIDRYVARHRSQLEIVGDPIVVPGGEVVKNDVSHVFDLHQQLDALGIDRQSFVLAIGGGAVLDMVGLAANTAHRGVRLIRVPTTVLAQCDSGIGVKNGINLYGKKNFFGTFAPPFAVMIDSELLSTLDRRDALAGMAEAVKVALVRDPELFEWVCQNVAALASSRPAEVEHLVRRSAELHLRHIANGGDPFELGSARPLDFGHWAAHKLEAMTGYRLRHGEAVAIGMRAAAELSAAQVGLSAEARTRLEVALDHLRLPVTMPATPLRALLAAMSNDKKSAHGDVRWVLTPQIGVASVPRAVDHSLVRAALLHAGARS